MGAGRTLGGQYDSYVAGPVDCDGAAATKQSSLFSY